MEIDKERAKEAVGRGTFVGYIPHRLEIEGKPELNNFPFNVLFSSYTNRNGNTIMGSAVYEPEFPTFLREGITQSMEYHNGYGGNSRLQIKYDTERNSWSGTKYVNGESVGSAFGPEWNGFFVHFTMLGLKNGERCEFNEVAKP